MPELENTTQKELADLMSEMVSNPATRSQALRLTKQLKPDLVIPELELEDRLAGERVTTAEQIEALQQQLRDRDMKELLEKKRARIRGNRKYGIESDEDVEAVENLMREKQIPDHDTAADYWSTQRQLAAATAPRHTAPKTPFAGVDMQAYLKDPKRAAVNEAHQAIDDLRNGTARL